jgi:ParB-like chromosome segregation protein Spo0J
METTTNGAVKTIEFAGETYTCPFADLLPPLTAEEYQELKEDIQANGVLYPVFIDDANNVIDGHNRLRIAVELDLPKHAVRMRNVEVEDAKKKEEIALNLNTHRRQLDRKQKQELIAKHIRIDPEQSDRQIADKVGVDHKTVGKVREGMEATGDVPHTPERTDKSGRKQKAKKSVKTKPESDAKKIGLVNQWVMLKSHARLLEDKAKKTNKMAKTPVKDRHPDLLRELAKDIRMVADAIERIDVAA